MSIVISESTRTACRKKREGRSSGDYFVFNACEIHFSCFIETLDSKGTKHTLKKILREPNNALTWRISLSLCDKH